MSTETITLQLPIRIYTDLTALAVEEHTDVVGVITRLLQLAYRDTIEPQQPDPVFALIGAYRSDHPLIDGISASEDPDLYLAQAASDESVGEKHAWEIAPTRYQIAKTHNPLHGTVVRYDDPFSSVAELDWETL